ncbi:serine/threonine-protein kinase [uncultured Desulfuromusa sp.]|uniref:serine/threonine protein kinase n=1 Tax=uncultured Desulfuromusa sp. TaxID=219183 RepID=UPI002AA63427|nr:serine/threonine-protein kinase [uncultured Desulfuromusa sp.]
MAYPTTDNVLQVLPNASNIEEVKVGAQKAVFLAVDPHIGKVVVKIMLPNGSPNRLLREIDIVVSNNLINVPQIYCHGTIEIEQNKALYILEEYIDGGDLRDYLSNQRRLPVADVLRLISNLLETIEQLEVCGVVHRDIKPENIIRDKAGKYWLLDFGIARDLGRASLTATVAHFGPHTAGYAAPEQFKNLKKKIDSRADLFSVGVVASEALSGEHPFAAGANGYLDLLKRTEMMTVQPFEISEDKSGELSNFINVLMNKFASRRPPSARVAKSWFDEIVNKHF